MHYLLQQTEGSPRPIQSPQKKKSSSPEVVTAGSDARRKDRGGQTEGMSGKSSAPKKEAKTTRDEAGEERKQEFQLVIKASKGKRDNPAVSPDNDPLPVSKAGKKEDPVVSKTTGTKGSTPVINVTKEDAPVVSKTTTAQGDTPVVSMTTPAKGDTPVVSMTTPAKGDNYKTKGDTSVVSNASKGKQKETAVSKETSDDVDVSDISKTEKTVKKKVPGEEEEGESEKREGEDGGRKEEEGVCVCVRVCACTCVCVCVCVCVCTRVHVSWSGVIYLTFQLYTVPCDVKILACSYILESRGVASLALALAIHIACVQSNMHSLKGSERKNVLRGSFKLHIPVVNYARIH